MKIGVVGAGSFAQSFVPLFQAHPWVEDVALAELVPERRRDYAEKFGIASVFASLEELLSSDVDAVAIFSQRHLHGKHTLAALKAGKHVYCAVPMASTLEDVEAILKETQEQGLIYMSGETSYYYPATVYCRDRYSRGDFGNFVYGEAQYLHDMSHGFYEAFQNSGGENWKSAAAYPPMLYPTHSVSMILSVTGARATHVSCLGYVDTNEDGVFRADTNPWRNVFSNETALLRTSDGGMSRINEFRRVGWGGRNSVYMSMYGTHGSFEEHAGGAAWASLTWGEVENLDPLLQCAASVKAASLQYRGVQHDFESGLAQVHHASRLPSGFDGLPNGHFGSHQFLVDDFVKALYHRKLPPIHAWEAAKYCVPGIIAHESATKEGVMLPIPDTGWFDSGWETLSPTDLAEAVQG